MSNRKWRVLNPPERIWLQVGDIEQDCDFSACSQADISWCADEIFDTDIEYRLVKSRRAITKPVAGEPKGDA